MRVLNNHKQYAFPKIIIGVSILTLVGFALFKGSAHGAIVTNGCADVLIVFARGSSDNPNANYLDFPFEKDFRDLEKVGGAFFQAMKNELDTNYPHVTYKAVSVHNFPNLYNQNGYRAVGIFGGPTIMNAFDAELSWWPWGEYRGSVSDGVDEVVGYVKDQQQLCPDQKIVMGGYSQGANVIGDSLFHFSNTELDKIQAVTLFGDPKYVGSNIDNESSRLNWFDTFTNLTTPGAKPIAEPWVRGTATLNDRGSLDARIPYVPQAMADKTLSWCFVDDFICTGGSGIYKTLKRQLDNLNPVINKDVIGEGHTRYPTFGVPQAAEEIVVRMSAELRQLEVARGGFDPNKGINQPTANKGSNDQINATIMLNTSAGVDDVLGQFRVNTPHVLPYILPFFPNAAIGLGDYSEVGTTEKRIPRVNIHTLPTRNTDQLYSRMISKLSYGTLSGGGLDIPDPHQIAIERAAMISSTDHSVKKHIILITDRPFQENYTYNICSSDVRIGFGIMSSNMCGTNPSLETGQARGNSERCAQVFKALTEPTCSVELTSPGFTYNVSRTREDAATFAIMNDVAVTVVVPHASAFLNANEELKLKKLAADSGGLFIKYDSFTKASYTDMIWRVLGHEPKRMPLAYIDKLDELDYTQGEAFTQLKGLTHTPVQLRVDAPKQFQQYAWDFDNNGIVDETTAVPQTEHVFVAPTKGFVRVSGKDQGQLYSSGLLPIDIQQNLVVFEDKIAPETVANFKATRLGTGIVLTWQPGMDDQLLFVSGPGNIWIKTIKANIGSTNIDDPDLSLESLSYWTENESGNSIRLSVAVEPEPTLEPEPDPIPNPLPVDLNPIVPPPSDNQPENPDPVVDSRPPTDKIIAVSESNTIGPPFNGSIAESPEKKTVAVVASSAQPNTQTTATGESNFTQVAGETTTAPADTNPQKVAPITQEQLAGEFEPKDESEGTDNKAPIVIVLVTILVLSIGAISAYTISRLKK